MTEKHTLALVLTLVLTLALAGCQKEDDSLIEEETYYPVRLIMGMEEMTETDGTTRALPSGYSEYSPASDPGRIGIFMTQNQAGQAVYTYTALSGHFTWESASSWKSSVAVKYDKNDPGGATNKYYAYGFMPAGSSSSIDAEITSEDFGAGATMTLTNVPPVSSQDVCIVTGVMTGTPTNPKADPSEYTYPSISDVGITEGEYTYMADTLSNAIYLLLKHIYAKYSLRMKVDESYNNLRTIKVTDMKLSASAPSMKVVVSYAHGSAPTVDFTALTTTTTLESDVFDKETALGTTAIDLTSFYCADGLSYIEIETTFDVYDKHGNRMRSNCVASNTIKVQKLEAGRHYTITATIKPTYLYQLSEPDLDKPTVVL